MGRPFLAPPGIPADRLAALRKAFDDTMADKDFLADAEQNKIEINPVSGEQIQALVKEGYQTPPDVVKKAAAALQYCKLKSAGYIRATPGKDRRAAIAATRLAGPTERRPSTEA